MAQFEPGKLHAWRSGINRKTGAEFGHIQRARRKVFLAVGHEDEQAAVGSVIAHQHRAVVGHDLDQLMRDAAQVEVLFDPTSQENIALRIDSAWRWLDGPNGPANARPSTESRPACPGACIPPDGTSNLHGDCDAIQII